MKLFETLPLSIQELEARHELSVIIPGDDPVDGEVDKKNIKCFGS